LEKDPKRRLRDIGDAWELLAESGQVSGLPEAEARVLHRWRWPAVVALLFVIAAPVLFVHFRETPPEARLMSTRINPPENTNFDFGGGVYCPPALSPDGRQIVFRARAADGKSRLWVRSLDSATAQPLAGTEGARHVFWSPDSRSIAFHANTKLKRIEVSGGPARTLADAVSFTCGSWSPQGIIIYAPGIGPLQRVAARGGGGPTPATTLTPGHNYRHYYPWFLPDGRHFLFV
jgi:hypothetical protein